MSQDLAQSKQFKAKKKKKCKDYGAAQYSTIESETKTPIIIFIIKVHGYFMGH